MLTHVPRGLVLALARMCAVLGHDATRACLKPDVPADVFRLARAVEMRFGPELLARDWRVMCLHIHDLLRFCSREFHALGRTATPTPTRAAPLALKPPTRALHNDHAGSIPDGMGSWSGSHARSHGAHSDRDQMRADDVRERVAHIVNTEPGSMRSHACAALRSKSLRGAVWGIDDAPNPFVVPVVRYNDVGPPIEDPVERERLAQVRRLRERAEDRRKSPRLEWTRI